VTGRVPLCQCCQHITGRPAVRAGYDWVHWHGESTLLCASCCAAWRANAVDDPSLLPREIHQLPGDADAGLT